jgi:hypothetical protein
MDTMESGGYYVTDLFAVLAACYVTRKWEEEPLWIMAVAPPGSGKALALDTPIPTPSGWKQNGDLKTGDTVFGGDGRPCRVLKAFPTMLDKTCYKVTFSDGTSVVADAEHLWETTADVSGAWREPSIKTTDEILDTLHKLSHKIRRVGPVVCEEKDLPINPYTLGIWLGDGNKNTSIISLNSKDAEEIVEEIRDEGEVADKVGVEKQNTLQFRIGRTHSNQSFHTKLRNHNLLYNKHIPEAYLRASIQQRLDLLQGIMDTDGYSSLEKGDCELTISNKTLALNCLELARSLGFEPQFGVGEATINGRSYGPKYRIRFRPHKRLPPFRIRRKLTRVKFWEDCQLHYRRRIESIEKVESVPVRCILVDSPDHLYLAGDGMVATHNTCTSNQFSELPDIEIVSAVTPASLISGWGGDKMDPSLFARIDRKLLVAKDFGTILSMSSNQIGEVFSYLREAFDGQVSKTFGMLTRDYPDLHFNFLAITTEACERVSAFRQQLGERFMRFDVDPVHLPSPPPKVDKALRGYVQEWMYGLETDEEPQLTDDQHQWISKVAKATTKLRTEVIHDNYSKEVLEIPRFEGSARLEKQMRKMFQGLLVVMGNEWEVKRLCKHAGKSSIKPRKLKVMKYLLSHPMEECTAKNIADTTRHGYNVINRLLRDLYVMGLAEREMRPQPKMYYWKVAAKYEDEFRLFLEDH